MSNALPTLWRWLAVAVAVALVSLGWSSGAAHAAGGVGNIDPSKTGSLTIHKFAGNEGSAGAGTQIGDTSNLGKPLSGVEFTIAPVSQKSGKAIDLTTPEGWDIIKGVQASDVTGGNGYTLGSGSPVTTGADGTATKSGLPLGLYLVTETNTGSNNVVTKSEPFLVTLPLPQSNGNWLYDVHVYPKNQVNDTTPEKTVDAPATPVLGSEVTWHIKAPVPSAKSFDKFVVTDQLDSRLSYVSAKVDNAGFAQGTDYTVAESNGLVSITFTAAGRAKLQAGTDISITLVTKVNSLGDDGVIKNKATVFVNDSKNDTNVPSTNWGPLQILKYAQGDEAKALAGATFDIFSDAGASTKVGTVTTGDDGRANISLWVGHNDVAQKDYWLKETKAPAGYVLDEQVRKVTVKANGTTSPVVIKVENVQQNHPKLPLTGANGQLMLTICGIGLVLIAVGAGVVTSSRRRRRG
ncbi:SpaH/EbpB family LPXTG-anchored major pilin [Brevibacterium sp. 5221]|uniref:SpaH/EbpB family LPXTG-anchored major pilin n=1 Tax=Brevibacterium rongguiense TaxID=2695267 RepID=A0A6N9HB81_9MICO|nr:SpaH/EbpB family LPXTG-anchored major pilin [Brevibacterium rongguiense]MYM20744.1 SpaH/EbpB family LPXTG-anchored major pilin [Brevibacterium rongguiense]